MDASVFDTHYYPTFSVQEGYILWADTYDEMKAGSSMDSPPLERIQPVIWEQMETAADLACGTGRIGVWLKEHPIVGRAQPVCRWLNPTAAVCYTRHSSSINYLGERDAHTFLFPSYDQRR